MENDYFILKLIILLMLFTLAFSIGSLFYKVHRDKVLKNRKEVYRRKLIMLLELYFGANNETRENALYDMRQLFQKHKDFRDITIAELRERVQNDKQNESYRKLFISLGGLETTQKELISKKPVTIYKGLLDVDFLRLSLPKDILLRLQKHSDTRISMMASFILFTYNDEISAGDILSLEPILSPMTEIKIYDELKRRTVMRSQKLPVCKVIGECLFSNDISDTMKDFLQKSLRLICNPK